MSFLRSKFPSGPQQRLSEGLRTIITSRSPAYLFIISARGGASSPLQSLTYNLWNSVTSVIWSSPLHPPGPSSLQAINRHHPSCFLPHPPPDTKRGIRQRWPTARTRPFFWQVLDTHANGVTEEAMYRQLRMAAGDIFRRGPDCLPMGTEIPLRFISDLHSLCRCILLERKARLFLQVPQKNRCRVTDYWIPQNHGDLAVKFF